MIPAPIVVFDLGGVVVRICRSWQEACRAAGVPFHARVAEPDLVTARAPLVRAYERGELSCPDYFRSIADSTAGLYTPDEVRRLHESWILGEYAGVSDLIDDLHHAGVATGVLSNTNASHWRQLAPGDHGPPRFPAACKPRHLHASHLLGLAKPSRDIYREFERLSGFQPASIVFFDDTPDNVRAAADAGWHARLIDHAGDPAAQMRAHLRGFGLPGAARTQERR